MRYLLCLFIFLSACAKPSTTVVTVTATPKALNSSWVSAMPDWTLDMTAYSATTSFQIGVTEDLGATCTVSALVKSFFDPQQADLTSGTMVLSGASGGINSACAQFNGIWDFYLLEDGLLLCNQTLPCVELQ